MIENFKNPIRNSPIALLKAFGLQDYRIPRCAIKIFLGEDDRDGGWGGWDGSNNKILIVHYNFWVGVKIYWIILNRSMLISVGIF